MLREFELREVASEWYPCDWQLITKLRELWRRFEQLTLSPNDNAQTVRQRNEWSSRIAGMIALDPSWFFKNWQPKDVVPVIISLAAFGVSVTTFCRQIQETRRLVRSQITDTVTKLVSTLVDIDAVDSEIKSKQEATDHLRKKRERLKRQLGLLAEATELIIQRGKKLVRPIDFFNLASAFDRLADDRADRYWRKAIAASAEVQAREGVDLRMFEVFTHRKYATFLFYNREDARAVASGRTQFQKAVDLLNGTTDRDHFERGWTYVTWARAENDIHQCEEAGRRRDDAMQAFSKVKNPSVKEENERLAAEDLKGIPPRNDER